MEKVLKELYFSVERDDKEHIIFLLTNNSRIFANRFDIYSQLFHKYRDNKEFLENLISAWLSGSKKKDKNLRKAFINAEEFYYNDKPKDSLELISSLACKEPYFNLLKAKCLVSLNQLDEALSISIELIKDSRCFLPSIELILHITYFYQFDFVKTLSLIQEYKRLYQDNNNKYLFWEYNSFIEWVDLTEEGINLFLKGIEKCSKKEFIAAANYFYRASLKYTDFEYYIWCYVYSMYLSDSFNLLRGEDYFNQVTAPYKQNSVKFFKALICYFNSDYDQAIRIFEEIENCKCNFLRKYLLFSSYTFCNKYDEALKIADFPNLNFNIFPPFLFRYIDIHKDLNNPLEIIRTRPLLESYKSQEFEKTIPGYNYYYVLPIKINIIRAYISLNLYREAEEMISDSCKNNPCLQFEVYKAYLNFLNNDFSGSLEILLDSLNRYSIDFDSLDKESWGIIDNILSHYEEPVADDFYLWKGITSSKLNRLDLAITLINKFIEKHPQHVLALTERLDILYTQKVREKEHLLELVEEVLAIDCKNKHASELLVSLTNQFEDPVKLEHYMNKYNDNPDILFFYTFNLIKNGKNHLAGEIHKRIIDINPKFYLSRIAILNSEDAMLSPHFLCDNLIALYNYFEIFAFEDLAKLTLYKIIANKMDNFIPDYLNIVSELIDLGPEFRFFDLFSTLRNSNNPFRSSKLSFIQ